MVGYYVDIANNGEEGFYKFREHSTTEKQKFYDIILMDVQMPIMDGLQATELIRKFEIEVLLLLIYLKLMVY